MDVKKFKQKKVNILGKTIPVWVLLVVGIITVAAAVSWILSQTTTFQLTGYATPIITSDITLTEFQIGEVRNEERVITNDNYAPMLVSSNWKVYMNSELIGEGYNVGDLQDFVHVPYIVISGTGYGCDDEFCTNLVIPPHGGVTYTMAYHVPITYVNSVGETVLVTEGDVPQVVWEPTVSVYDGDDFDGSHIFDNPNHPTWNTFVTPEP